jgi:hypothetical protein
MPSDTEKHNQQNAEGNNASETPEHSYLNKLETRVYELMHDIPETVHDVFRRHRRTAFERHPFLFSTLGLFGLVATWQGFEDIVERIELLRTYPSIMLGAGLVILLFTGRLYRHLDQQ